MNEKVYCINCTCIEIQNGFAMDERHKQYFCHRKAGQPKRVDRYNWCYEGIYRYGDKGE